MKKRDEQSRSREEKLDAALAKLEEGVSIFQSSDKFKEYLKTMSRFHNYSFNNSLLIYLQKPDATYCAGYTTWKSMGRFVKAGEKGLTILAPAFRKKEVPVLHKDGSPVLGADGKPMTEEHMIPYYRAASTFDYSQTEGKPLPELISELQGKVDDYERLFCAVTEVANAKGTAVGFENIQTGAKGYYAPMENRIAVNNGMSEMQNIKTVFHELAHSRLDCMERKEEEGLKTNRNGRETRAEACAFVCCEHYGLDCSEYSFPYLTSWASGYDLRELREQMDNIRRTASDIISDVDEALWKNTVKETESPGMAKAAPAAEGKKDTKHKKSKDKEQARCR